MNRKSHNALISSTLVFGLTALTAACAVPNDISDSPENIVSPTPETEVIATPDDLGNQNDGSTPEKIPVIWDDDGSPDGMIALLYLLRHPTFEVKAITVSCGEAHPKVFAENISRMLTRIGYNSIPVAAGREFPLEGNNAFPDEWRAATDIFWEVDLPEAGTPIETRMASLVIIDTVKNSPVPVTIFLTGNHTNLAEALRLDPSIANNINRIQVMGGALFIPGNIASDYPAIPNTVAEWNIWVDPIAAEEVFQSGIPIQLMPLDATSYVIWTEEDAAAWEETGTPEGILSAEILRWMLRSWFPTGVFAWDVVAAVDLTDPEYCIHEDHFVWVDTASGDEQGRTLVDDRQAPNMSVCLLPNQDQNKAALLEIFKLP